MTAQSYHLEFGGYWREPNRGGIPNQSGIYSVYTSTYNASAQTVSLHKLVYIGESENVRDRIEGHEKWPAWRRHLQLGQQLSFSYAPIAGGRERAEAAMIFRHKPPENDEYVDNFPYERTTITTAGRNALLAQRFTVETSRAATLW